MRKYRTILVLGAFFLAGLCLVVTLLMFGSGLTLWLGWQQTANVSPTPRPTRRPVRLVLATPTATLPTLSATAAPTAAPSSTPTPSPQPTDTATPTSSPSSPTPLPPTMTPTPSPRPPTVTATPTTIPTPSFAFTALETEKFPTSHPNFDVYIAVTDAENTPLSGYRVLGSHSSGLQLESRVSASAWTENSGAMHYKAGNIKYEVFNSPDGVWTLQLVDEAGQPVAPPLEFPFDPANPTWYFILYRQTE